MAMKVLFLANSLQGLYSFRKELVVALLERGDEVYISAPQHELFDSFEKKGCQMIPTDVDSRGLNPLRDIQLCYRYWSIINQVKPNVVLTYTIKPNLYGGLACRLSRTPQLANITGLGTAVENPGLLRQLIIGMYRICLSKAKMVFFQNTENRDFCIQHKMVTSPIALLPGSGVNLQLFSYHDYPKDTPVRFLFMGRVMHPKGIDNYLEAADVIKRKYGDSVEFHVLGKCDDDYKPVIASYVQKEIIVYHAPVKDVTPYLINAHCLIHPTFYPEGMSNVLLESCAIGRPVITTNRSGCREIADDGINGYIVESKNTESLIGKIEKFLSLPYGKKREMGIMGRRKVEKNFDRKIVVSAYLGEIDKLAIE